MQNREESLDLLTFKIAAVHKNAEVFYLDYSRLQKNCIFKAWIYTSGTNGMGMTQRALPLLCS